MANNAIIIFGTIILIIGFLLAIVALVLSTARTGNATSKSGAVLIIGPIPIILGSDLRVARQLLILAIVVVLTFVILYLMQVF